MNSRNNRTILNGEWCKRLKSWARVTVRRPLITQFESRRDFEQEMRSLSLVLICQTPLAFSLNGAKKQRWLRWIDATNNASLRVVVLQATHSHRFLTKSISVG